ncbi:MAG: DJ-1/PfpI family protein [Fusobacteriales bacterium]|jgi:4-methyl-5(b-hydroxyethyl)-thiazole monophosphate biosynthesis|nr:DJ-1/PfpI family protein [Fusobacteriales bacterium]
MKVAEFIVEGFEQIEAVTPVDILRRAGITVDTVSVSDRKKVKSSHDVVIETDKNMKDINFDDYEMLILPGGPGTENYEKSDFLMEELLNFSKNKKKYIAAICAAPGVLARLGILKNKKAVSFPSVESDLEKNGAVLLRENVITDGNITTSRGAGTAVDFSLRLIEILKGKDEAERIAKQIVYK